MTEQPQAISAFPVDLTEMKKTVGGKMEVIRVLVDHVLVDFPEKMRQLRHGWAVGDAGQVRIIAHTLKSSLASFGAAEAREIARALEICGATGDMAGAEKILPQLEQEIERIVVFFSDPCWPDKG
ncbi:MAG: Hpt domain-containing protein [Desulfurivibrionaceae bacterium]|jgi:HPt (histidine-containing phosphotransfer) domain-containing protein